MSALNDAAAAAIFVDRLYHGLAGTDTPDPTGYDYWVGLLLSGTAPGDVEHQFAGAVAAAAGLPAPAAPKP